MKRMNRELWAGAAAAAVAFLIVACGETGTTPTTCANDAACGTGKMCHPTLKQCITSCTAGADCPSSSKTCATFAGGAYAADSGVAAFCQCSTDALCSSDGTQLCQSSIKVCAAKCTSNTDCGGATCDTASGKCSGSTAVVDAGTDAGTATACNSNNAEPDTCGYGNVCNSSNGCDAIVEDTCANVAAAVTKSNHSVWLPATSTGPIIYNVVPQTAVQADCANEADGGVPAAFTVTVYAYARTDDFPAQKSNLPGFSYLTVSGNKVDVPLNLLKQSGYYPSGKNMSATFTLCGAVGSTSLQAAFAFTGGNAYCASLTK